MFSDMHIVAGMSRTIELLEQSQRFARIGSWEWLVEDDKILWTDEMFHLMELDVADDNMISLTDAYKHVHPNDIERVRKLQLQDAQSIEFDYTAVTATGNLLYIHCWCKHHHDAAGKLFKIGGSCQDISSFKKSEEDVDRQNDMLQHAEETARMGSWKYNFATKQVYFSDNLFSLFGYEQRFAHEDVYKILEHVLPEDVTRILSTYQQTIADGQERSADFRLQKSNELHYFTSKGRMAKNRIGQQIIVGNVQDVTEQYLLQKKLEAQNDFIQKLIDSSVNIISVLDKNKKYVLWNKGCEKNYGFTKEEVIGKTAREVYKDTDTTWFEEATDKALKGETVRLDSFPSITGRFYEIHLIPLKNQFDEIDHVFVLIHDTTDLIKLNEKLRQQKDFAEAIIDNSAAVVFVFDKNLRYRVWNKQSEISYGKTKEEVIGRTLDEVFAGWDMTVPNARLQKALQGETVHYPAEHSFVIDKYYDSYVIPIKDEVGEVECILCLMNDVTEVINTSHRIKEANRLLEQKKTELADRTHFLETLLDASGDLIGAYDKDLNLIEINKASLERFGFEKTAVLGQSAYELFPGIENTIQFQHLQKALEGTPAYGYEFQSLKSDKYFVGSAIPLKNKNDEVFAALTIGHDITEMKKAAIEMEELNNLLGTKNYELNRINSELASFSYVASHDLQEPLRKIQAFISLILAKDFSSLSANAQDYFQRIQASANRMQQMIDGLLSFSRTNTTIKNFELRDLKEMVVKIISKLNQEIITRQALIENNVSHSLTIIPHQLEQMLEHIILNALKFQKEGNKPVIHIASQVVAGKDIEGEVAQRNIDYCKISITDNGVGFEMKNVEKIFQMFQRLHGKSEYPGTGIGLAICRRIAQNHNGFITAQSQPENGSTFNIFLPFSTTLDK
ncbi:MAG TPA: PAS domain-containing protein [Flavipsychrobacter sp.]|nr:PAS domain-containing protein [Flavipsychrobacter sp.]